MRPSKKQIWGKLSLFVRQRNKKHSKLDGDKIPRENIPKVYRTIGRQSQVIGLYSLSIGECEDSKVEFTTSVLWYRDALEKLRGRRNSAWESESNNALDVLYSALLSGDEKLVSEAAKSALEVPDEYVDRFPTTYRYYYLKAFATAILETDDQQYYLDELEKTLGDLDGTKEAFFEPLWAALSGLTHRDTEAFLTGIEQFLAWHHSQVDFENKTSAKDLVCRQATALIVLARQKGMDVRVESEYIPECIYELM